MAAVYDRDAEGLQAVERNDYPEVVHQHTPLEVASPREDASAKRDVYGPGEYSIEESNSQRDAWPQSHESKGMISSAADAKNEKGYTADTAKSRTCGMRRLHFWLLMLLILVAMLAIILGGVLGTRASKSNPT